MLHKPLSVRSVPYKSQLSQDLFLFPFKIRHHKKMKNANIFLKASRELPWLLVTIRILRTEKQRGNDGTIFLIKQVLINISQCLFSSLDHILSKTTRWNFIKLKLFILQFRVLIPFLVSILADKSVSFFLPSCGKLGRRKVGIRHLLPQRLEDGAFFLHDLAGTEYWNTLTFSS